MYKKPLLFTRLTRKDPPFRAGDVRVLLILFVLKLLPLGALLLCTSSLWLFSYRVVEIRCFSETLLSGMEG